MQKYITLRLAGDGSRYGANRPGQARVNVTQHYSEVIKSTLIPTLIVYGAVLPPISFSKIHFLASPVHKHYTNIINKTSAIC